MRKTLGYLFTLAIPVAAAGLGLLWILGTMRGGDGLVYDTAAASRGAIRKMVTTSGPVRALVTVSVGSQLSGQVDAVKVDYNSEVKPGDVLATIDSKTFAAKVTQARADVAAAEAALANQEAALVKAEAVLKLAERNIERQRTLAAKGFAAQSALDTATRDAEVGQADITVAKAQIESAKATIKQRKAQLDQAEIDLERTEIRSPTDGTVISRTVDPGQTVAASLQSPELFKIAQDLSRIRIEAQVNEADVGGISEGNPATFTVDAYPDRQFEGKVTQVRLSAIEINSVVTYTVIVEAANEGRKLFPGMTANVVILTASREGALRVVNDAFRFKPRNAGSGGSGRRNGQGGGDRLARMLENLKSEVGLTAAQEEAVRAALAKLGEETRESAQGFGVAPADPQAARQRANARIDQALSPLLAEAQRPAYDKWKQGRDATRAAALWVLGSGGVPERRFVRIGIADDQFTEVVGGDLEEGDKVVLRAREARS
jgi:HlyD family secretion protein